MKKLIFSLILALVSVFSVANGQMVPEVPSIEFGDLKSGTQIKNHFLNTTTSFSCGQADHAWTNAILLTNNWRNNFIVRKASAFLEVGLDKASLEATSAYNYRFSFSLVLSASTGVTSQLVDVFLSYDPESNKTLTDYSTVSFDGVHKIQASLLGVARWDEQSQSYVPLNWTQAATNYFVRTKVNVSVYEKSTGGAGGAYNEPFSISGSFLSDNNLRITVTEPSNYFCFPSLYEIQWKYVEDFAASAGGTIPPNLLPYDFNEGANAVYSSTGEITIPALYDRGYLVFRARRLRSDSVTFQRVYYSDWFGAPASGMVNAAGQCAIMISSHYAGRVNWQSKLVFFEDQKHKAVVDYFDGTYRKRQSITKNSTDNKLLATESIYDYSGKPVINSLPAGLNGSKLELQPPLLQSVNNLQVNRNQFDSIAGACIPMSLGPVNQNTGAGAYYSTNNNITGINADYIPNASGFPYTQTRYLPGSGGLIEEQSAPGSQLYLGSGKTTTLKRGNVPQYVLNKYFGGEAGETKNFVAHYTTDPNTQQTLTIQDGAGKVILSGLLAPPAAPATMAFENDHSLNPSNEIVLVDLLPNNASNVDPVTGSISDEVVFNNQISGIKDFQYHVDKAVVNWTYNSCTAMCLNCSYLLEIAIFDECGGLVYTLPDSLKQITPSQGCSLSLSNVSFNAPLGVGLYTIRRTLRPTTAGIDARLAAVDQNLKNCSIDEDVFIAHEVNQLQDADCKPASPCDAIEEMLISQLMPGGLYASFSYNANEDSYELLNTSSNAYYSRNSLYECFSNHWVGTHPNNPFPMILSNNDTIHNWGEFMLDDPATTRRLLTGMTREIAKKLLPVHPDYCRLSECKAFQEPSSQPGKYAQVLGAIKTAKQFSIYFGSTPLNDDIFSIMESSDPALSLLPAGGPNSFLPISSSAQISYSEKYIKSGFLAVDADNSEPVMKDFLDAAYSEFTNTNGGQKLNTFVTEEMHDEFVRSTIETYLEKRRNYLGEYGVYGQNHTCYVCEAGSSSPSPLTRRRDQFSAAGMVNGNFQNLVDDIINHPEIAGVLVGGEINNELDLICGFAVADIIKSLRMCEKIDASFYLSLENYLEGLCQANKKITYVDLITFFNGAQISQTSYCNPFLADLAKWFGDASMNQNAAFAGLSIPEMFKEDIVDLLRRFAGEGISYGEVTFKVTPELDIYLMKNSRINYSINYNNFSVINNASLPNAQSFVFEKPNSSESFTWVFYGFANNAAIDFTQHFEVVDISPLNEIYTESVLPMGIHRMGYHALLTVVQNGVTKTCKFWNNAIPIFGIPVKTKLQNNQCVSCKAIKAEFQEFIGYLNSNTEIYGDDEFLLGSFINYLKSNAIVDIGVKELEKLMGDCDIFKDKNIARRDAKYILRLNASKDLNAFRQEFQSFLTTRLENPTQVDDLNFTFLFKSLNGTQTVYKVNWGVTDTSFITAFFEFIEVSPDYDSLVEITPKLVLRIPPGHNLLQPNSPVHPYLQTSITSDYTEFGGGTGRMIEFSTNTLSHADIELLFDELSDSGSPYHLAKDRIDERMYIKKVPLGVTQKLVDGNSNTLNYRNLMDMVYSHRNDPTVEQEELLIESASPSAIAAKLKSTGYQFDVDHNFSPCIDCRNSTMVCELVEGNTRDELANWDASHKIIFPHDPNNPLIYKLATVNYKCISSSLQNGNLKMLFRETQGNKIFSIWVYMPQIALTSGVVRILLDGLSMFTSVGQGNGGSNLVKVSKLVVVSLDALSNEQSTMHDVVFQFEWNTAQCYELPSMRFCPDRTSEGVDTLSCERDNYLRARKRGSENYKQEYNKAIDDLKADYFAQCSLFMNDSLTTTIRDELAAVTLYYYDRLGNLVQTVPPQGVQPLASNLATRPINTLLPVDHKMETRYRYNSLNLPGFQSTPDGGDTYFWYDLQGRVWASRNAKQLMSNTFSYTFYDELGRIVETGEAKNTSAAIDLNINLSPGSSFLALSSSAFKNWVTTNFVRNDVVQTTYDVGLLPSNAITGRVPSNLINRVARIAYYVNRSDITNQYVATMRYATHYSYDVSGNVAWLVQEFTDLTPLNQRYKLITYDYDLVSGNVKLVSYQPGSTDQFYHKYEYDAENRITSTLTSDNGVIWQEDARYFYYLHGPLARVKLGSYDVQGVDYAYTIQGWLKSMNGVQNLVSADIGRDGEGIYQPSNPNKYVGRDVAAFSLRYFSGDYQSTKPTARNLNVSNLPVYANLYNGNIAAMSVGVHDFGALSKTYLYDYLNRLMDSESYPLSSAGAHQSGSNFATSYSYDLNGNILTLLRNGNNSQGAAMDELQYSYYGANNRLRNVYDLVGANTAYTNDFKNTNPNLQFGYDQIGNLTSDLDGNTIAWNPYGKVASVVNSLANRTLSFGYSATGERVFKEVNVGSHITDRSSEYYVRDASGNLMALYEVGVQAANTAANISTINSHLSGIDPSLLQNLMQAMLQNRAFLQTLAEYIVENRWLAEYLAQSNLEIASFFAWNPGLIRIVFGNEEIRNYFYTNHKSLLINAINCDPVDLLTLMLSDPTKGRQIIDLICQNGNYHTLMHELFNEMGVSSCADLKNMLQTHAMAMALVIKQFNEQQQPLLLDILTDLFNDPGFVSHFAGIGAFNDFLGAALTVCIDPLEFGGIMNDFWGGEFARFLEYVGEQAIIESLLLGNFESFFLYLTSQQSASEIMTTIINRMQNFGVVEYLEWIRQVLGQSVYNQIMQLSPNILNFEKVITLKEQYLYGSKRLGVRKPHLQLAAAPHTAVGFQTPNEPQAPGGWFNNDCMCYTYEEPVPVGGTPPPPANTTFTARFYTHTLGKKEYELTNHLGNVLATVLDRKTGVKASPTATTYAWFKADVSTAQDYYPFGSLMPGRTYVAPTGAGYRFGFNGMQRDDEIKGPGNSLDFGARMYDSRLGRLWSNDPRWREFPAWSVYSYASNSPILFIDEEGEGPGHSILKWLANETKGTWSVQAYGSISIGVVRTAAKGMAVDKYGNVALLMTSSSGWQGNSVGASAGVSLSYYPFQSARDVTGKSLSMGAQGSFFYKSLSAGATVDMGLNEKGKASGKGSITLSLGVGIEASPAAVSPVFMANNTTAILLSETDFSKIENGYSQLLSRTIDLNQKKGNTGFYSPISSTLDFVPTSNEGEFEAVLRQTYEYRPFTGGAKNQVVTETISTGIRLQADDGNLRSDNLVQPSAAQR